MCKVMHHSPGRRQMQLVRDLVKGNICPFKWVYSVLCNGQLYGW